MIQTEEFYRVLVEQSSDLLALLDGEGKYIYVSPSVIKVLGYTREELITKDAFNLIHPDDIEVIMELWSSLSTNKYVEASNYRYKVASGEWRWFETIAINHLDTPSIGAVVINSRYITERKEREIAVKQSEIKYRSLFENNPDMVYYQNKEGYILDINLSASRLYGDLNILMKILQNTACDLR